MLEQPSVSNRPGQLVVDDRPSPPLALTKGPEGHDGPAQRVARAVPAVGAAAAVALSHELRTPLNAILGNLGLLLDGTAGPLSGDARACLADMQRGARQLLDRVQMLLGDVERATSAAPETPPGGVDLVELIRDAHQAAAGSGTVELRPAGGRWPVSGPGFWWRAAAAAVVELHRASAPSGAPLLLTVAPAVLRIGWPGLAPGQLAAAPRALLDAIVGHQGGRLVPTDDGVGLHWQAPTAHQSRAAQPSAMSSSSPGAG